MTGATEGSTSGPASTSEATFETKASPQELYPVYDTSRKLRDDPLNMPEALEQRFGTSGSGGIPLGLRQTLFERHRDMSPDLNREDYRCRQQQRSHGHVRYGRYNHRQLGLYRIAPPGHACEERRKP